MYKNPSTLYEKDGVPTIQLTPPSDANEQPLITLLKWTVLITSLIGGASVGAFYFYIHPECQLLKSSWRMLALIFGLLPLVYYEYSKHKDTYLYSKENLMKIQAWDSMWWASLGHSVWTVGFLVSLNHTSVAQANLFCNFCPIVIIIYKSMKQISVTQLEIAGTLLAIVGAIFLAFDTNIESNSDIVDLGRVGVIDRLIFGDLIAIIGSIGGAFFLTKNQELKYDYPLYLGILIMSFLGFLQISFASIILEGATLSFDPATGIFGLFSSEWFMMYIYITIVAGYCGYFAYILSLQYFDALVVSVVLTLEPPVGALIVFILGWQPFPGALTILGMLCILPGIIAVTTGGEKKPRLSTPVKIDRKKLVIPLIPLNSE